MNQNRNGRYISRLVGGGGGQDPYGTDQQNNSENSSPYSAPDPQGSSGSDPGVTPLPNDTRFPDTSASTTPSATSAATTDPNSSGSTSSTSQQSNSTTPPPEDFSRLQGYSWDKYNANKDDAKYHIGHTLSQFDPRKGITPDVLAALNSLGYGTFSGSGDKLSLSGLTDLGKKMGLTGDYKDADFIIGLKGGNGHWGYADPVAEAASQGGAAAAGSAGGGGGSLTDTLSQYYGIPGSTGGVTTNVSDQLKDLLSKYYGNNGMNLRFGSGVSGNN